MLTIKEFRALGLEGMRRCSRCGEIKPREQFCKDRCKPDGYDSRCKECDKKRCRERYNQPEVREKARQYAARRRQDPEYRARMREYNRKHGAAYYQRRKLRRDQERKPKPGFVYVLQAGPYYKIGMTINLSSRLAQIKPRLPFPAELIHSIPTEDMIAAEQSLHSQFSHCRLNGEWFALSTNDLAKLMRISSIKKQGLPDDD